MRRTGEAEPLRLQSGDLDAARLALSPVPRRPVRIGWVVACAGLMTAAALALCAVVVLGAGSPQGPDAPADVRAPLRR